jgi:hypothetical protein
MTVLLMVVVGHGGLRIPVWHDDCDPRCWACPPLFDTLHAAVALGSDASHAGRWVFPCPCAFLMDTFCGVV